VSHARSTAFPANVGSKFLQLNSANFRRLHTTQGTFQSIHKALQVMQPSLFNEPSSG